MGRFGDVSVPAALLFLPGWKVRAMAWIIVRIVLVAVGFWLGGCAMGAR
jgi:hypothetical protein